MPKYRHTFEDVDAIQWTGDNFSEVVYFVGNSVDKEHVTGLTFQILETNFDFEIITQTTESHRVHLNCWIVCNPNFKFSTYTSDFFDQKFEEIEYPPPSKAWDGIVESMRKWYKEKEQSESIETDRQYWRRQVKELKPVWQWFNAKADSESIQVTDEEGIDSPYAEEELADTNRFQEHKYYKDSSGNVIHIVTVQKTTDGIMISYHQHFNRVFTFDKEYLHNFKSDWEEYIPKFQSGRKRE